MFLYPHENTNDSLETILDEAIHIPVDESSHLILLENEDRIKAEYITGLLKEYKPSIVMEHSLFACLLDPNTYLYRFIGRFPGDLALFEFFDNEEEDVRRLKAETRSAFEDSLFSYLLGNIKRAYSGFLTVYKLNPRDSVAHHYISLCEKQLENHRVSDV